MVSFIQQFKILMHKNFILKKRGKRNTIAEMFFPIYWVVILFVTNTINKTSTGTVHPAVPSYPPAQNMPLFAACWGSGGVNCYDFAYSPADLSASGMAVIDQMQYFNGFPPQKTFESREDLINFYNSNHGALWGAIVLDETNFTAPNVVYDIYTNNTGYGVLSTAYLALQQTFANALINVRKQFSGDNQTIYITATTTQYPSPESVTRLDLNELLFPFYFPFLFIYSLQQVVVLVVTEKEKRVQEAFRVMGMKELPYWLSWYCTQALINMIAIVVFMASIYFTKIIHYTSFVLVFVSVFLFGTSVIVFGLIVSVFASKPKAATAISVLMLMMMMAIAEFGIYFFFEKVPALKYVCFCLFVVPFSAFATDLAEYEFDHKALPWANEHTILFQVFDLVVMLIILWYSANVYGGEYSAGKPWFFMFKSSKKSKNPRSDERSPLLVNDHATEAGIDIIGLKKVYNKSGIQTKAVDGLSLRIAPSEILALLGHNGAGKTTTMSVLTGLTPPTSGSVKVMGYDVVEEMDSIRNSIGFCPQHNILLDQLTCAEHLYIFALLKGVPESAVQQEITNKLAEVGLTDKRDEFSKSLSGGMKRKLSVAIAFIGNSDVIFLDECTAGMDPYSRRQIWSLLQKYKSKKTIVMTTHFMEEAELLGDRIAIMSKGKLRCIGSSLELKNEFGVGYVLRVVKDDPAVDVSQSLNMAIAQYFGVSGPVESPSNLENIYQLPQQTAKFTEFFNFLDSNTRKYNIKSYGLSMTTLEEVFLKIAHEDQQHEEQH